MTDQDDKRTTTSVDGHTRKPAPMSRRALLRGGVTAMPAILTLHSGAALARSSNLISAAPGSRDGNGNVLCLDTSTADMLDNGKYDYHDPGYAKLNVLEDTYYYEGPGQSGAQWTADEFCELGTSGNYKPLAGGPLQTYNLDSPGIVVSSNAYLSLSSRISVVIKP
jgi:hypothetical protein